jgi:hypothetical protein
VKGDCYTGIKSLTEKGIGTSLKGAEMNQIKKIDTFQMQTF